MAFAKIIKMFKIWIYKKADENNNLVDRVIKEVPRGLADKCYIYTDSNRDRVSYNQLKEDISKNSGILFFLKLTDISFDFHVIAVELDWLMRQGVMLGVLEYPASFVFKNIEINHAVIRMLEDVLGKHASLKISDTKIKQHTPGRRKHTYPENWIVLYQQWKNNEITAVEFMEKAGVKKGTFYHLIQDYEMTIRNIVTVKEIT